MSFRTAALAWLVTLAMGSAGLAANKQAVRVERISDVPKSDIFLAPSLAAADTCFVSDNQVLMWRINGWVTGQELYKSLMNPAHQCEGPYPFTITAINMPMMFDAPTPLTIGVDVEAVDSTTFPGCPVPGILLAVSTTWDTEVPSAGFYNIWVPLDTPLVVNGPFFAGFYIGNTFAASVNPSVLTDSVPALCATYNIWDDTIGFVDLCDSANWGGAWAFPGRLAMEVAGIPGGGSGVSPVLEIVSPINGAVLYGSKELWAWDRAQTGQVEYVMFEYSNGGPFVEIGRDFDGVSPLRDGVNPAVSGNGFSVPWDFSSLPEGSYSLRVTIVDTAGASTSTTITVYLEPTPPTATIVAPTPGYPMCTPLNINMSISDENMTFVEVQRRQAANVYTLNVTAMNQATVGDVNGILTDGNHASNGEFGDFYSAPVAATVAAFVWNSRGHPALVRQGGNPMTQQQVAEAIAAEFRTRQFLGTYDEAVPAGLTSYAAGRGGGFRFDYKRDPSYADLRIWVEDEERVVLLGLGNNPGLWVTVDGFVGFLRPDSTYFVSVANPISGTVQSCLWRDRYGYSELNIQGSWHRVDIMVSILASAWSVTRTMVGVDFNGQDGWSVNWPSQGITDLTYHYLRGIGHDSDNNLGPFALLYEHNCAAVYVAGDYNGDRSATVSDLLLLIDFITRNGSSPSGGAARADCNCDNIVNIADVIYYMNYLYGQASPPCR
ncbi:MAG: dockerin type I domain-containing protein [Candidatus Zixiibacteriota bacterium]